MKPNVHQWLESFVDTPERMNVYLGGDMFECPCECRVFTYTGDRCNCGCNNRVFRCESCGHQYTGTLDTGAPQ